MATLVSIVVTQEYGSPDGYDSPTGGVEFQLTEAIVSPGYVSPITVPAPLSLGGIAQELVANDLDSAGQPISPETTQYQVRENILGSAEQDYYVTVPARPPGSRSVSDAITAEGLRTLVSATAAFTVDDRGAYVFVPGFPVGTQIQTVVDAHTVTLTQAATATATGVALLIGASVALSALRPPA